MKVKRYPTTKLFALFLVVSTLPSLIYGQNQSRKFKKQSVEPTANSKTEFLDEYLSRTAAHGFSGSVIVAQGDKILLRKGYGTIDRRGGNIVLPNTVFSLASLDKQFIATAILRLEEMGKLRVTDSITKFFDFIPADKASITIHQLLSHTSGLGNEYWDDHREMPRSDFVRFVMKERTLEYESGKGWEYSNSGFVVLEEIIERASGKKYEAFMEDAVFKPSGMKDSGYPSRKWNKANLARYQLWTDDLADKFVDAEDLLKRPRANWVMMSTVDDLYKWYLALRGDTILSAASKQKLFTRVRAGYGYGWYILPTSRKTTLIHHGGSGSGVGMQATFRWFKDEDVFVGILSNSSNPTLSADYFCPDIEAIIFGGSVQMPPASGIASKPPQNIAGKYELPDGGKFEVVKVLGDRLVIKTLDQNATLQFRFPDSSVPNDVIPQDEIGTEVLLGAFNNDFEPLRKNLWEKESFEGMQANAKKIVEQQRSKMGELKNVSTVYQRWFVFDGFPEVHSFVRLQFERGNSLFRIIHFPSGKLTLNPTNIPSDYEILLSPSPTGGYTTWDFTLGTGARIYFEEAEGKTPAQLKINGSYGSIYANKQAN